ncbi:MAG: D-alanyl-D-alanine carboxypeptidase [Xenococcaceae cyanobacterium MO_188.B29]|nr:D-alanyl-D-alanine carboxypeptidase [Xenococcaceae cyanobacterium MO_188.B29]
MLEVISFGIISFLAEIFTRSPVEIEQIQLLAWQNTELFILPDLTPDPVAEKIVDDYLQALTDRGISPTRQGVWIQSDWHKLVDHNGNRLRSAASLTKIATTLAALSTYGADYQFETKIYAVGEIKEGVLQGDLLVEGNHDPFFVWEEAIALGNTLQKLGIRKVTGKLIVNDKFYMNYKSKSLVAGELLLKSLNEKMWSAEVASQYLTLPLGTLRPQIQIVGGVEVVEGAGEQGSRGAEEVGGAEGAEGVGERRIKLLVRHQSLPLAEILRQMNIYSNNEMAQMLADALGGASKVMSIAEEFAFVSSGDISLINGSGLGEENRIAPYAVCQMLMAIDRLLNSHSLNVVDLFPVADRDLVGTMQNRAIPKGTAVKTGTLDRVSALAGVIPTRERGNIWFAIINSGSQTEFLRKEQDRLIQRLANHWQLNSLDLTNSSSSYLGDPARNQVLN